MTSTKQNSTSRHASFTRSSTSYIYIYILNLAFWRDCRRIDDLTRHFSECELSFNERLFDFGTGEAPQSLECTARAWPCHSSPLRAANPPSSFVQPLTGPVIICTRRWTRRGGARQRKKEKFEFLSVRFVSTIKRINRRLVGPVP